MHYFINLFNTIFACFAINGSNLILPSAVVNGFLLLKLNNITSLA